MRSFIAVLLCAAFLALGPGPCRADDHPDVIRLGVVAAATGEVSTSNKALFLAARFAVEEINAVDGLLGRKVVVWEYDNQSSSLGSKRAAEEAVADGVAAVIGASWSSHSLAMAPVLQAARVPMITPISTSPEVTRVGDYIFRCCYTDDAQGAVMARFARKRLGAARAVTLVNVSRVYSSGLARQFEETFLSLGGHVIGHGAYTLDTADYAQMLETVSGASPDVIYLPGDYRDSSFIIKQARDMGLSTPILGGDAFGLRLYDYIGRAAEGCYYTTHWHRDSPQPRSKAFVEKWEGRFGTIKQTTIPLTYDAVMLWADAVRRAGATDGPMVRATLATADYFGVTGRITFNGHGDPRRPVVICRLQDGDTAFVDSVEP